MKFVMMSADAGQIGRQYTVGYFVNESPSVIRKYRCKLAHNSNSSNKPPNTLYWTLDLSTYSDTIKPSQLFNISNRGAKGFRCTNWYNRSFYDMQDDGGQSRVLFFEAMACEISNYLVDDNLGLLYGMGHAGLTMMGNSWPNSTGNDFHLYNDSLGSTTRPHNFGQAYLDYSNRDFNDETDNFILFGAGTLKVRSY